MTLGEKTSSYFHRTSYVYLFLLGELRQKYMVCEDLNISYIIIRIDDVLIEKAADIESKEE